jgi:hypothetical protein
VEVINAYIIVGVQNSSNLSYKMQGQLILKQDDVAEDIWPTAVVAMLAKDGVVGIVLGQSASL